MAIKTYSYKKDGNKKISEHTTVKEFASIQGNKLYSDKVIVDEKLMDMIEKLYTKLNCLTYIISSGYRTSTHDKAVGGNGKGQHTLGKAVDCCFYGKNNKIIPSPIVCCVAQDLGFKGIANISTNYKYVHLDMRSSGTYYGDEIKSTKTVTKDFRKYFSISEDDIEKYTGKIVKKSTTKYYKKYEGKSTQIDTVLKAVGVPNKYYGKWSKRKPIAKANGIKVYIGTASQNTKLVNLAKKGKLVKP